MVTEKRVKSFTEFHSVSQCLTQSFTVFDTVAPEGRNVGSFRHSEMLVAPAGRSVKSYIFMEHRLRESDRFLRIFSLIADA
jgi:hypothetical protein